MAGRPSIFVASLQKQPIRAFRYVQRNTGRPVAVTPFLLRVRGQVTFSQTFHEPAWFDADAAIDTLAERRGARFVDEFRKVIQHAAERLTPRGGR